jgi:hypothetical protein
MTAGRRDIRPGVWVSGYSINVVSRCRKNEYVCERFVVIFL